MPETAAPTPAQAALERRRRYAQLRREKTDLDARLREIAGEIDELEPQLLDDFAELGTDTLRVELDDGQRMTLSITDDPKLTVLARRAGDGGPDQGAVVEALRTVGLDQYVQPEGYKWQGLNSYLKGLRARGEELHPALANVVELQDGTKINARRVST